MALYRNDGHGHFTDVTATPAWTSAFMEWVWLLADYDNDGLADVSSPAFTATASFTTRQWQIS